MFNVITVLSDIWGWVRTHPEKVTSWIKENPIPFTIILAVSAICATVAVVSVFA